MAQDVISQAWNCMRRRNFASAVKLLEGRSEIYEDNFEYYLALGVACLYIGDIGSAITNFQMARHIKLVDTRLLLGQAAIFLRRGDTDRALQYYMEVKEADPRNPIAADAIEFIRTRGDYDTICRWVDTGRIEQFYPPLGMNPEKAAGIIIPVLACILGCILAVIYIPKANANYYDGARKDLTSLSLSSDEEKNPQEKDLSGQNYKYILSSKKITDTYEKILMYFQDNRDNAAQMEINRLLNSNASISIKQKTNVIMSYLEPPTFDSITDAPSYAKVEEDPSLYLDCYVCWSGRISDAVTNPDGSYSCRLLVGYESGEKIDGIVNVTFDRDPKIIPDQSVKILGKINSEDRKIYLLGRAVYQSVKDTL